MTQQQMQYAYWQRMRQQQLYRAYVAAAGAAIDVKEYEGLCFTAEESDSTVMLSNVVGTYQTSIDGQNWTDYEVGQDTMTLSNVGDKVYFAAKTENDTCWNHNDQQKFIMTGKIAASGNIQSLVDKTCKKTVVLSCCYKNMFKDCISLTKAPALSAMTLSENCYDSMFLGCTSLATAPELPATTLAKNCYQFMFLSCSSLTSTPELPAKQLASHCYDTMFKNCTSLSVASTLSSEELYDYCYANMFNGCTNLKISEDGTSGSIVLALKSGTTGADAWNQNMFEGTTRTFTGDPSIGKTYRCYQ